jgi:hypothetical protein
MHTHKMQMHACRQRSSRAFRDVRARGGYEQTPSNGKRVRAAPTRGVHLKPSAAEPWSPLDSTRALGMCLSVKASWRIVCWASDVLDSAWEFIGALASPRPVNSPQTSTAESFNRTLSHAHAHLRLPSRGRCSLEQFATGAAYSRRERGPATNVNEGGSFSFHRSSAEKILTDN